MAVLLHEDIESQGYTHEEAVEMSPDTALLISHAARELLRVIREEERGKLKGRKVCRSLASSLVQGTAGYDGSQAHPITRSSFGNRE